MLTLAGLEDPSKAPSFQSVVLDQIKHLRKQLEEDEESAVKASYRSSGGGQGDYEDDDMGMDEGRPEIRYGVSGVVGGDGLPQMLEEGPVVRAPPLIIQP